METPLKPTSTTKLEEIFKAWDNYTIELSIGRYGYLNWDVWSGARDDAEKALHDLCEIEICPLEDGSVDFAIVGGCLMLSEIDWPDPHAIYIMGEDVHD